jgi:hypothetical protein
MPMIRTMAAGTVLLAIAMGSGASVATADTPKAKKDCVVQREINVIRALDDKHVYIKVAADDHYLFTLDTQCPGLSAARKVGLSGDSPTRVCEGGVSMITFELPGTAPMRCRIDTITRVKSKEAAEELIASEQPPK